ncbi:DUF349 domain-containing protein [Flavobacterium sp. CBA20B-1]|uniref:DUF349 domain-containing protein n=1 Tax=unclassified Flavobacterium TaxID=196869 RepID=UPI002224D09D|nr:MULTISPECIES: DUF349 domain-containing protein [unclassified Flavobacterium]WCM42634.1 DUF349 domain-containing protein [Flavobacterium sp. CBA20B-1]
MLEEKNDNLHEADGFTTENESNTIVDQINSTNAEDGETSSINENNDIPLLDYDELSLEALNEQLDLLLKNEKVTAIREHVETIKRSFLQKYHDVIDEKRTLFLEENPDAYASDFQYDLPAKNHFDSLYSHYRDQRNKHFKSIQDQLKKNLAERNQIIEELKDLVENTDNYNAALKDINQLRERWRNAGSIPKDNYNHVWNNFHFHLERFYDQLHMDREARDLDFKNNLEQKQKLIERASLLIHEKDIRKAFRELQTLHRVWKEEIGPVAKEYREEIWHNFSNITKELHNKREMLQNEIRQREEQNLEQKKELIAAIEQIATKSFHSHNDWQNGIKEIEELRTKFFNTGRVPAEQSEETWTAFKNATRNFNVLKNNFYKDIKKEQQDNLAKKQALVEQAKALNESSDFETVTPLMKKIQEEWKHIGHVPRKFSDSLWKEFKQTCNAYFDRLHAERSKEIEAEMENFHKKKEYLESLKDFQLTGDHKTDLDGIKAHIENWKSLGVVPQTRRHIEGKFNKILDALFDKLSLSKKEAELVKFNNKIEHLIENNDNRRLQNETIFVQRKIEEIRSEIFQLENNVQFISNAKADNPLVKEINKNIDRHKDELNLWKEKLDQLKNIPKNDE